MNQIIQKMTNEDVAELVSGMDAEKVSGLSTTTPSSSQFFIKYTYLYGQTLHRVVLNSK